MATLAKMLAQAVRNSLNLPNLNVTVRRNRTRGTWSFRLHKNGTSSEWLELDAGAIEIMRQLGLLPALHLGTFRVAYMELRRATEANESK